MAHAAIDQRRQQRNGRCTTPNDHNLLALVVEILRPELRVHCLAGKVVRQPRNVRKHGLVIAVVARAQDHPLGPVHDPLCLLAAANIDLHLPSLLLRAPVGRRNSAVVAYALLNVKLGHRLLQVRKDVVTRRNGVARFPRIELEAQRVQVRVGAHAGVLELRPRAAELVAALEDGERRVGQLCLHAVRGIDAGDAGADDQHIEMCGVVRVACRVARGGGGVAVHGGRGCVGP